MSNNKLCQILGIEKPIIQGPMSWVSTAPLVAAASEAGGFGVLGTAVAPVDFIQEQMKAVNKLTTKPFGFNMGFHPAVLSEEYLDDVLKIIKAERPTAVHLDALSNIDPDFARKCFSQFHDAGVKIIAKVFTMKDALLVEENGADVIIVKGWEGGGHLTFQTTMVLVPQAADLVNVPLVASGGIADGRGMAAAIALGADGVEMGTVFLAAEETAIHANAKQAIIDASDMPTVEIGASANQPCRQLRNKLSDKVMQIEKDYPKEIAGEKVSALVGDSLRIAMQEGDVLEKGAVMAGQIAPLIKEIKPVKVIIDTTIAECKRVLKSKSDFFF